MNQHMYLALRQLSSLTSPQLSMVYSTFHNIALTFNCFYFLYCFNLDFMFVSLSFGGAIVRNIMNCIIASFA